ncbi:hypothetical protein B0H10DRAFT_2186881, partial [Mycena sp. CBHHK59/15]
MGRDNPDPALILQSSRQRKPVTDPTNGEPVVTAMEALVTRIDQLSHALPKTVASVHATTRFIMLCIAFMARMILMALPHLTGAWIFSCRLHHVRRGANGMTLIVKYLEKVEWSAMMCDIATI